MTGVDSSMTFNGSSRSESPARTTVTLVFHRGDDSSVSPVDESRKGRNVNRSRRLKVSENTIRVLKHSLVKSHVDWLDFTDRISATVNTFLVSLGSIIVKSFIFSDLSIESSLVCFIFSVISVRFVEILKILFEGIVIEFIVLWRRTKHCSEKDCGKNNSFHELLLRSYLCILIN